MDYKHAGEWCCDNCCHSSTTAVYGNDCELMCTGNYTVHCIDEDGCDSMSHTTKEKRNE